MEQHTDLRLTPYVNPLTSSDGEKCKNSWETRHKAKRPSVVRPTTSDCFPHTSS